MEVGSCTYCEVFLLQFVLDCSYYEGSTSREVYEKGELSDLMS